MYFFVSTARPLKAQFLVNAGNTTFQTVYLTSGTRASIFCLATAEPMPTFRWRYTYNSVLPISLFIPSPTLTHGRQWRSGLTIISMDCRHTSRFTCEASNKFGSSQKVDTVLRVTGELTVPHRRLIQCLE